MFKVTRSLCPSDWNNENYRDPIIVSQLKKDFFSKCYLCELKNFGNMNVEHFSPHLNQDEELKTEWNNLYYACSHCNGIKGSRHRELLDCCEESHRVNKAVGLYLPSVPNGKIRIENLCNASDPLYELTNKTIALLVQCYNNSNSGPQQVSHEYLIEQILEESVYFQQLRFELKKNFDRMTEAKKEELIEKINNMVKPNYPFSAFWKTYIRNDHFLIEVLRELKT